MVIMWSGSVVCGLWSVSVVCGLCLWSVVCGLSDLEELVGSRGPVGVSTDAAYRHG